MTRLLIVRLGALGDIVHAIPVAAALRRAFESARIDWLVSAAHREILDLVPVIDRRLVINDRVAAQGSASFLSTIRELRRSQYDAAFDLQGLLKSALLARSSGAPRVIGFSSAYARESLARLFYTEAHDPGCGGLYDPRETRHVVDINLSVLQLVGITTGKPEFPIEIVESAVARRAAELTDGRYALLNPGAAWPNKRWPPERFGALAFALLERHRLASIVLWGPAEEAIADAVIASSQGAAVSIGTTTIADVVALARGAAIMVSGDTGPMHVASAVRTPIVGIYGPTRPARNGPMTPQDVTVSRDDVCHCHHLRRCKLDRMCLLDITVEDVVSAVDRRLAVERVRA
ncbi:MAG TPA: glycosyltransferase family 9 protein [Vicinamibacterales bacterium]|nr:glycosyltransferase family 9 protein [Vicinamibacterales bacterium]